MVKIAHSIALCALSAAASAVLTQADGINKLAYTDTGTDVVLNATSPQVGYPVETTYPVVTPSTGPKTRRLEDATNADVTDLETYLGESLEADFTTLKDQYAQGAAPTTPWPGSYWPTYQDSINVQWKAGEASPSEKYAKAFGLDATDFMNKISADNGIDSRSRNRACTEDSDCETLNDESVCAKRAGATSGYCIPTWYGICHAWSPAAILEAEPQCDVVKNGVTFHVLDIKALLSEIYDGASITTIFTSVRFNGPDTPASEDKYGRFTSVARRDLGAGFFHLAIANLMGKHKQSFVVDVTSGSQVWNQPVRSYSVDTMELVDVKEASLQYFDNETYPFNSEMVYLAYVKLTFSWVVEGYADGPLVSTGKVDNYTVSDDYEYLLELDESYAVIGGEWVGDSRYDHPDFLWFPTSKPDASTVTSTGLSYADVQELLEMSVSCSSSSGSTSESTSASTGTSASASASTSASTAASNSGISSTGGSTVASSSASTSTSSSTATSTGGSTASAGTSTSGSATTLTSGSTSTSGSTTASTSGSTSESGTASASTSTSTSGSERSSTGSNNYGSNEDGSSSSSTTQTDITQTGKTTSTTPYADDSTTLATGVGNYTPVLIDLNTTSTIDTSDASTSPVGQDVTAAPAQEAASSTTGQVSQSNKCGVK